MLKSLKIVLLIIGLGVFILPKQMIFAQNIENCCSKSSEKENCCKTEKSKPCHDSNSQNQSEKNTCGNDCSSCHTCSVNFVINYISPDAYSPLNKNLFAKSNRFNYKISFFPSTIHNIWQPPKLI